MHFATVFISGFIGCSVLSAFLPSTADAEVESASKPLIFWQAYNQTNQVHPLVLKAGPNSGHRHLQFAQAAVTQAIDPLRAHACFGSSVVSWNPTYNVACFGAPVDISTTGVLAKCQNGFSGSIAMGSVANMGAGPIAKPLDQGYAKICDYPPNVTESTLVAVALLDMTLTYDCLQGSWAFDSATFVYDTNCSSYGAQVLLSSQTSKTFNTTLSGLGIQNAPFYPATLLSFTKDGLRNTFDGCGGDTYSQHGLSRNYANPSCPDDGSGTSQSFTASIDKTKPYVCGGTVMEGQLGIATATTSWCLGTSASLATSGVSSQCFAVSGSPQIVYGNYNSYSQFPLCDMPPTATGYVAMALLSLEVVNNCSTTNSWYVARATFIYAACDPAVQSYVTLTNSSAQFSTQIVTQSVFRAATRSTWGYVLTSDTGTAPVSSSCTFNAPAGKQACAAPSPNSSIVDQTRPVVCFIDTSSTTPAEVCIGVAATFSSQGVSAQCRQMPFNDATVGITASSGYLWQTTASEARSFQIPMCTPPVLSARDLQPMRFGAAVLVNLTVQDSCNSDGTWRIVNLVFAYERCDNYSQIIQVSPSSPTFTSEAMYAPWQHATLKSLTVGGVKVSYSDQHCQYYEPKNDPYASSCVPPEPGGAGWQEAVPDSFDRTSPIFCFGSGTSEGGQCFGKATSADLDAGVTVNCNQLSMMGISPAGSSIWLGTIYPNFMGFTTCDSPPNPGQYGTGMLLLDANITHNCSSSAGSWTISNIIVAYANCSDDGTAVITSSSSRFNTSLHWSQDIYNPWTAMYLNAVQYPNSTIPTLTTEMCSFDRPTECSNSSNLETSLESMIANRTSVCVMRTTPPGGGWPGEICVGPSAALSTSSGLQVQCTSAQNAIATAWCLRDSTSTETCTQMPFDICEMPPGVSATTPVALALTSITISTPNMTADQLTNVYLPSTAAPVSSVLVWNIPSVQIAYQICNSTSDQVVLNSTSPVYSTRIGNHQFQQYSLSTVNVPAAQTKFNQTSFAPGTVSYYSAPPNDTCLVNASNVAPLVQGILNTSLPYFCSLSGKGGYCYGSTPNLTMGVGVPCTVASSPKFFPGVANVYLPFSASTFSLMGLRFPWCQLPIEQIFGLPSRNVNLNGKGIAIALVNGTLHKSTVPNCTDDLVYEGDFVYELCSEEEIDGIVQVKLGTSPSFHASFSPNDAGFTIYPTVEIIDEVQTTIRAFGIGSCWSQCDTYSSPLPHPYAPTTSDNAAAVADDLQRMSNYVDLNLPMLCADGYMAYNFGDFKTPLNLCYGTSPYLASSMGMQVECSQSPFLTISTGVYAGTSEISLTAGMIQASACDSPPQSLSATTWYAVALKKLFLIKGDPVSGSPDTIVASLAYAVCPSTQRSVRLDDSTPTFNSTISMLSPLSPYLSFNFTNITWIENGLTQSISREGLMKANVCGQSPINITSQIAKSIDASLPYICANYYSASITNAYMISNTCVGISSALTNSSIGLGGSYTFPYEGAEGFEIPSILVGCVSQSSDGSVQTASCYTSLVVGTIPYKVFPNGIGSYATVALSNITEWHCDSVKGIVVTEVEVVYWPGSINGLLLNTQDFPHIRIPTLDLKFQQDTLNSSMTITSNGMSTPCFHTTSSPTTGSPSLSPTTKAPTTGTPSTSPTTSAPSRTPSRAPTCRFTNQCPRGFGGTLPQSGCLDCTPCPAYGYESLNDVDFLNCENLSCLNGYWCGSGAIETLTPQANSYRLAIKHDTSVSIPVVVGKQNSFVVSYTNIDPVSKAIELSPGQLQHDALSVDGLSQGDTIVLSAGETIQLTFMIDGKALDPTLSQQSIVLMIPWRMLDDPVSFMANTTVSVLQITAVVTPTQFTYTLPLGASTETLHPAPTISIFNTLCNSSVFWSVTHECSPTVLAPPPRWFSFVDIRPDGSTHKLVPGAGLPATFDFAVSINESTVDVDTRQAAPLLSTCFTVRVFIEEFNVTVVEPITVEVVVTAPCPPGTWSTTGSTQHVSGCQPCGLGSYTETYGSPACLTCPSEFPHTLDVGATSSEMCAASPQSLRGPNGTLMSCSALPGTNCSGVGVTVRSLELLPGYWRPSADSLQVTPCLHPQYCLGGSILSAEHSESNSSELSSNMLCSEHHRGVQCEICEPGYVKRGALALCTVCSPEDVAADQQRLGLVLTGLIGGAILAVILAWNWPTILVAWLDSDSPRCRRFAGLCGVRRLTPKSEESHRGRRCCNCLIHNTRRVKHDVVRTARETVKDEQSNVAVHIIHTVERAELDWGPFNKLRITIGFFQVVSGMSFAFQVELPAFFTQVRKALTLLTLDVAQLVSYGCAIDAESYYLSLLLGTLVPIVAISILIVIYIAYSHFTTKGRPENAPIDERSRVILTSIATLGFVISFLSYPGVSSLILSGYRCTSYEVSPSIQVLALDVSPSIDCSSSMYHSYLSYIIFLTIFWVFGTPVTYFLFLCVRRKKLDPRSVKYPKEKDALKIRDDVEKNYELQTMSFLFRPYRVHAWWFEVWETLRKLGQSSMATFLPTDSATQLGFQLLLTVIALVIVGGVRPYQESSEAFLNTASLWLIFCISQLAFVLKMASTSSIPLADDVVQSINVVLIALVILMPVLMCLTMVWDAYRYASTDLAEIGKDRPKTPKRPPPICSVFRDALGGGDFENADYSSDKQVEEQSTKGQTQVQPVSGEGDHADVESGASHSRDVRETLSVDQHTRPALDKRRKSSRAHPYVSGLDGHGTLHKPSGTFEMEMPSYYTPHHVHGGQQSVVQSRQEGSNLQDGQVHPRATSYLLDVFFRA